MKILQELQLRCFWEGRTAIRWTWRSAFSSAPVTDRILTWDIVNVKYTNIKNGNVKNTGLKTRHYNGFADRAFGNTMYSNVFGGMHAKREGSYATS
jgi:hypothetical protein